MGIMIVVEPGICTWAERSLGARRPGDRLDRLCAFSV